MLNLAVLLENSAHEHPDRTAVALGDLRLSYSTVNAVANQVADLLRSRGLGKGSKVALSCPNVPYFPFVYYGALKAGATVVPLNVLLETTELAEHLGRCDADALFCFEGTADLPMGQRGSEAVRLLGTDIPLVLMPADPTATRSSVEGAELFTAAIDGRPTRFDTVATQPTDTAVILFGSGTTGVAPRGAELTHHNMLLNAMVVGSVFERVDRDIFLAALPLFHSFGQTILMNAGFYRSATLVLLPRFEVAAALALMAREKVTLFAGVPSMYWELLASEAGSGVDRAALGALRHAISGGAAMPKQLLASFREKFGVEILEGYGLSETSPVASFNRPDRPSRPGSIGLPVWGVEMGLIRPDQTPITGEGPGEIVIRGHNVMKGYHGDPEATARVLRNGWLRTGDIGRRDRDGYYYVMDRTVEVIVRDGQRIYPRDIEEIMITHPAVSLVAVLGVPREDADTEIRAYVIAEPNAGATEDDVLLWCRQNLPGHSRPDVVRFRERFPTTATGKILKRELPSL